MKISFYDPDEQRPKQKKGTNASFTMDWVSELGWKTNPFSLQERIAGFSSEEQEVNLFFIKNYRFGTITAAQGMGKTTLLNWLAGELRSQNDFRVVALDAVSLPTQKELCSEIADEFRGLFGKGKPLSVGELVDLLDKKSTNTRVVVLVDNAEELQKPHFSVLEEILKLPNTQILLAATKKIKDLPADDQLKLVIKKRDHGQNAEILIDRIESVGGQELHPFTHTVIERMTKETDSISDFLQLAHETAIHIALNTLTVSKDESEERVAKRSEKQASRTKKTSSGVKAKEKTKYDDLIESLGEELTK